MGTKKYNARRAMIFPAWVSEVTIKQWASIIFLIIGI